MLAATIRPPEINRMENRDQTSASETDCHCSPVRKTDTQIPGSGNGKKAGVEYAKVKV